MSDLGTIRRGLETLWTDDRGAVLLAIAAGWFLSIGVRLVYPVLLPALRTEYGLSLSQAGLLLSVLWVAYALGQLPGGMFADRFGEGRILVVSTTLSAVTIALVATAATVSVLFAATALFGLATALYGVARYTALSDLFPDNDGAAVGITLAAGEVGNALLPPLAGFIAAALAWQYGFGFTVPLFLGVSLYLWLALPARTSGPTSAVDSLSLETGRYVLVALAKPAIVIATLVQLLGFAVWQVYTGFYPTYLIEVKGLPTAFVTVMFGLFFALGVVVQPLSGAAYDRFGIRRSLPAVMGCAAVGLALFPLLEGLVPILLITMLSSTLLGVTVMTMPYLTGALPTDMQGTGLGTIRTTFMLIGAGAPAVAGVLADLDLFDEVFFLLAGLAVVALALSQLLPDQ
nr:MFS transporter [Natrononativus amylolyticus]